MSHWRRLVIDSRFRTEDSESHANFRVALKYPVQLPRGSRMYVDAVQMSHSWTTVISGKNDHLYLEEEIISPFLQTPLRVLVIPHGNYNTATLRTTLQTVLNHGKSVAGDYTVTLDQDAFAIHLTADPSTERARLYTSSAADRKYLETTIPATYVGNHANELIGHHETETPIEIYTGSSLYMKFADLSHYKQVFLHAPGLGESSMQLSNGNTDCVRRFVCNTVRGEIITSELQHSLAPITFSSDTALNVLHFQLKGSDGELLPVFGHEVSFELVIVRPGDE